jgi:type VI protein secretion system component Hcp
MGKSKDKKTKGSKPSVSVNDLEPKKDSKGGKVTLSDIPFTHPMDKSTPKL